VHRGHHVQTIAAPVVNEYLERLAFAKLGFVSSLGDLDTDTAACFLMISSRIERIKEDELESKQRKKKRRG